MACRKKPCSCDIDASLRQSAGSCATNSRTSIAAHTTPRLCKVCPGMRSPQAPTRFSTPRLRSQQLFALCLTRQRQQSKNLFHEHSRRCRTVTHGQMGVLAELICVRNAVLPAGTKRTSRPGRGLTLGGKCAAIMKKSSALRWSPLTSNMLPSVWYGSAALGASLTTSSNSATASSRLQQRRTVQTAHIELKAYDADGVNQ